MDEARRFLRYLTPGLVFVIEALALLAVSNGGGLKADLEQLLSDETVSALLETGGLFAFVSLLVLSGGLGTIFSHIHHALHWTIWRSLGIGAHHQLLSTHGVCDEDNRMQPVADMAELIEDARTRREAPEPAPESLFRQLAWRFRQGIRDVSKRLRGGNPSAHAEWVAVTTLWYVRREDANAIKGADARAASLSDLVHGSGTSLVASLAAVAVWAAAVRASADVSLRGAWLALPLLLVHGHSYWTTSRLARDTIEAILVSVLKKEEAASKPSAGGEADTTSKPVVAAEIQART